MPRARIKSTGTGYQIGEATTEAVAFHGATPVAQRAGAAQAAVTLTSAQVTTATATDLPSSEALANALKTAHNAVQTDVAALNTLVTELQAALVQKGLIKGSA